jgi:hypothetical protein
MKKLVAAVLALGVVFAPVSASYAAISVGVGPVGVRIGHSHAGYRYDRPYRYYRGRCVRRMVKNNGVWHPATACF